MPRVITCKITPFRPFLYLIFPKTRSKILFIILEKREIMQFLLIIAAAFRGIAQIIPETNLTSPVKIFPFSLLFFSIC